MKCLLHHSSMEFFLDTADVDEIREIASWGILDGVTTNPSLIKKSGRDFKQVVAEIASICEGPISAEVTAMDTDGMVQQALELKNDKVTKTPRISYHFWLWLLGHCAGDAFTQPGSEGGGFDP